MDILRSSGIPADCVSVDATLPYYTDRVLINRLETDVFRKTEIADYKNYWFIGNSLGALGAILYAQTHPGKIKGIIMLGPYLGEGPVPDEIQKSGGLLKWGPNITAQVARSQDFINHETILSNTKLCTHDLPAEQVLRQAGIHEK